MANLSKSPAVPRRRRPRPSYPRCVGLGVVALVAACGGSVQVSGEGDEGGNGGSSTGAIAGGMPPPFDAGPGGMAGAGAGGNNQGGGHEGGHILGDMPDPWDGGAGGVGGAGGSGQAGGLDGGAPDPWSEEAS